MLASKKYRKQDFLLAREVNYLVRIKNFAFEEFVSDQKNQFLY
jgi:hypothetical protein